jgi:hypothetical protein
MLSNTGNKDGWALRLGPPRPWDTLDVGTTTRVLLYFHTTKCRASLEASNLTTAQKCLHLIISYQAETFQDLRHDRDRPLRFTLSVSAALSTEIIV